MIPILIFLKLHINIRNDMAAIIKHTIAIFLICLGSCPLMTVISIWPSALSQHTTPNATITPKYNTIVDITKHPPQALIKNNNNNDSISVKNIIDSEIGHVDFKSEMD